MSGSIERIAAGACIGACILIAACAQASPPHRNPSPTAKEKLELKSAYSQWRRAETCAMHTPAGPAPGGKEQVARAKAVISRAADMGLGPLIDAIDAEYRHLDATIDWACAYDKHLSPEAVQRERLATLKSAVDRLARAVGAAIADN